MCSVGGGLVYSEDPERWAIELLVDSRLEERGRRLGRTAWGKEPTEYKCVRVAGAYTVR